MTGIMTTEQITSKLNAYEGDNIWQDVILGLDDYDEVKTDDIENGSSDRFALITGAVIRFEGSTGEWHVVA